MRYPKEPKIPFTTSFPVWFVEGLRKLSQHKGEDVNNLIMAAMLKDYPQLKRNASPILQELLSAKTE